MGTAALLMTCAAALMTAKRGSRFGSRGLRSGTVDLEKEYLGFGFGWGEVLQ